MPTKLKISNLKNAPLEFFIPDKAQLQSHDREGLLLTIPPEVALGRGISSVTDEILGNSMVDEEQMRARTPEGQMVEFRLFEVESQSQFRSYLGISAAASFRGLGGGFSAKAQFVKSTEINNFHNFVLVHVKVQNQAVRLQEYYLRDEALQHLSGNQQDFYYRYGDRFIDSITTGGEFLAVIDLVSQSRAEQQAIRAEISAKGGMWKASAEFTKSMQEISRFRTVSVTVHKAGGSGPIPPQEKLIDAALAFPHEVRSNGGTPVPISFGTQTYDVASNRPPGNRINLEPVQRILNRLATNRDLAVT